MYSLSHFKHNYSCIHYDLITLFLTFTGFFSRNEMPEEQTDIRTENTVKKTSQLSGCKAGLFPRL